jgi:hypothetical protein
VICLGFNATEEVFSDKETLTDFCDGVADESDNFFMTILALW